MSSRKIKKSTRKAVIEQYGSHCYICGCEVASVFLLENVKSVSKGLVIFECGGRMRELPLMTLDHIKPRSKGGNNSIENLRPCCNSCNVNKGNKIVL